MARIIRWCGAALFILVACGMLLPQSTFAQSRTYTLDADFLEGTLNNVTMVPADQLQLDDTTEPFGFIWVAASSRGTIVKIDTDTGDILGEYYSAPNGRGRNPSRTTVDANGNVWAGNRDEAGGGQGSIVHVGLDESGQCVDRNNNGTIETSTGLGDIRPWSNAGGADDGGGVTTAEDECIIHYTRTLPTRVRTIAVDASNDLWVGSYTDDWHQKVDGATGTVIPSTEFNVGCGGYGAVIDGAGVLWSASLSPLSVLRFDPVANTKQCIPIGGYSYGLAVAADGYIWHSNWTHNTVTRISPDGTSISVYPSGRGNRGVAVTSDGSIWIANSLDNTVTRHNADGTIAATIPVGTHPTGVAVDGAGLVWATNLNSHNVSRIDPVTNLVELTVSLGAGAGPYNYSDMTGSALTAPPNSGTWTADYDSGIPGAYWNMVSWTADLNGGGLAVDVASSADGTTFGPFVVATNGNPPGVADGQYLRIRVQLARSSDGDSPILYDLTVSANRDPVCENAFADPGMIWPPNHAMVSVAFDGVTDPDGDALSYTVLTIMQDEPVDSQGDGGFQPDGDGVGTGTPFVRAERAGTKKVGGNGRVYEMGFLAEDGNGGTCQGMVDVCVPNSMGKNGGGCVNDGAVFDSTVPVASKGLAEGPVFAAYPNPFNPQTRIVYTLANQAAVSLRLFDVMGREVMRLTDGVVPAGQHEVTLDASSLTSGIYLARLAVDGQATSIRLVLLR